MTRKNKFTVLCVDAAGIIKLVETDVPEGPFTIDDQRRVIWNFTNILMERSASFLKKLSNEPEMDAFKKSIEYILEVCGEICNVVNDPSLNRKGAVIDDDLLEKIYGLALLCLQIGGWRQILDLAGVLSKEQLQRKILQMTMGGLAGLAEVKETVAAGAAEAAADRGKKHTDVMAKLDEQEKRRGKKKVTQKEALAIMRKAHDLVYHDDYAAPEWSLTTRTLRNWNNGNSTPEGFTLNCGTADFGKWAVEYYSEMRNKRGLRNVQHYGEAEKMDAKIYKQKPEIFKQEPGEK